MPDKIEDQLVELSHLFKRYDVVYRNVAQKYDLPPLSLWILYVLQMTPYCTQAELASQLYHSKQSINSALKILLADGHVVLEYAANSKKSKYIRLTESGNALAEKTAKAIVEADKAALQYLTEEERKQFIRLFDRYTNALENEMGKL